MHDLTLPPSLAVELGDLRRRLANLERSPSIPFSSTRGGVFSFLDEDGNLRFGLGNVVLPANTFISGTGVYGVTAWGDGGAVVLAALEGDRGLVYPTQQAAFHAPAAQVVTSGSFATLFEDFWDVPPAPVLRVGLAVITDVGTVGEIKIVDGVSASATSVLSLPSGTNGIADFEWLHPATTGIGDDRVGRVASLFPQIQVRRVSGAGNVTVFPPLRQYFASTLAYPSAATNGHPVLS